MLRWVAGALLTMLAFAPAAYAGPNRCDGNASDAVGNSVSVSITLKMGVDIREIEARWTLAPADKSIGGQWTNLEVGYEAVTLDGLGPPTSVTFNFGPLSRGLQLDTMAFTLDSGQSWTPGYTNRIFSQISVRPSREWYHPSEPRPPGLPEDTGVNPDLMNLLEAAHGATMSWHSPNPAQSRSVAFDLSDHAGRDALFARAMAEARGKMRTAAKDCPEAYGGPPE